MRIPLPAPVLLVCSLLAACGAGPARESAPDVVLVVLDTLRRDACDPSLGEKGGESVLSTLAQGLPGGLTPNLAALAREGVVFTQAFSAAPWTVPSHASILTGLLPSSHGCIARRPRLIHPERTLAELLRAKGYQTAAFFSNPWLSERASGVLRGFDVQEESPIGGLGVLATGRGDQGGARTLGNVERWLGERDPDRPLFLFVNLFEAHLPYDPPLSVRRSFSPPLPDDDQVSIQWGHEFNAGLHPSDQVDWERVRRLYAADVHQVDRLLGRLIGILKGAGLYDDTLLVVTSDHGENLGDHGLMEHQFSVHETLLAVPLVVRWPAGHPGSSSLPVSTADIFATVAKSAGVIPDGPRPHSLPLSPGEEGDPRRAIFSDYFQPHPELIALLHSLNPKGNFAAFEQARRTVRSGPMRLTVTSGGGVRLYDMQADPPQEHDLSAERPRVLTRLERLLAEVPIDMPTGEVPVMDEATRAKIEGMGYATGGDGK